MNLFILSALDKIQEVLVEEFTQTIPTKDIVLSLVVATVSALIINYIYKKTYKGVSYSQTFALSIILLTLVTSLVIRTINSNLSLSLGMVGALSIVRFRTAVKDPIDTIFMFWAITIGIMSGAGLYLITILATLIIGILYFISCTYQFRKTNKQILIIKATIPKAEAIIELMKQEAKCTLKTESYKNDVGELTYEIANRSVAETLLKHKTEEGILAINIIDVE